MIKEKWGKQGGRKGGERKQKLQEQQRQKVQHLVIY